MTKFRLALMLVSGSVAMMVALLLALSPKTNVAAMALRAENATIHTVGGACGATIQACIDFATAGDRVVVPAGTYTESLLLNKAVSVTGVNSATTIIHAPTDQRVLLVTGASINSTVVISGLTLTGGKNSNYYSPLCPANEFCGGGILVNEGASPTLQNLTISGNEAARGAGIYTTDNSHPNLSGIFLHSNTAYDKGGGLYALGALEITNSRFVNNNAFQGSGLYIQASLEIHDTQFISNGYSGNQGGGAYVAGNLTLVGGYFASNSGTALYVIGNTEIQNSQFISNTGGYGSGAYIEGNLTVTDGRFADNQGDALRVSGILNLNYVQFLRNQGRGIFAQGPTTIAHSLFMHNAASEDGGALYALKPLTVTDSEFISNTAYQSGGGVYAFGETRIIRSRFVENVATYYDGGGLSVGSQQGATVNLIDSEFRDNFALGGGGGALVQGPITVTNGLFVGNTSGSIQTGGHGGGGLWHSGSSALISNTTFISNTAHSIGGGAYIASPITLQGGRFEHNVSGGAGGGIVVFGVYGNPSQVIGTEFISNISKGSGGGAWFYKSDLVEPIHLSNIRFEDNSALGVAPFGHGGGLLVTGLAVVTDAVFLRNRAIGDGGGMLISSNLTMQNSQFIDNKSEGFGGGLGLIGDATPYQKLNLFNSQFVGNLAGKGGGGAYGGAGGSVTNVRFERNSTTNGDGGGLVAFGYSVDLMNIRTSEFLSNTASGYGGGLYTGDSVVTSSRFQGNRAGQDGGGVYIGFTLANANTVSNTLFVENISGRYGGGAAAYSTNLTGIQFVHNRASYGGGLAGIGGHRNGYIDAKNLLFARNIVTGTGAAVSISGPAVLNYLTIADASLNPTAAIYFQGECGNNSGCDSLSLHNSILTNHAVGLEKAPSIGVEDGNVTYSLDYDLFFGVTKPISATEIIAGVHNLKADPLFAAPANDNYRLLPNSPAIDRADVADCPAIDVEGNPRPQGLGCDMGAFESAPVLPVIELAPTGLNFIAMQGVAQPAAQPVQVKNIGVGLLSWSATPAANWLSATPGSSPAPGNVNIGVNHNSLAIGSHSGNVVISGNAVNPSVSLPVTVEVLSACTPLLANGNFESNVTVWSQSTSTGGALIQPNSNLSQYVTPRSGSQAVLLGSQDGQTSDLSQPLKIPAGAPLNLTYAYFIKTSESSCGEDEVQVRFGDVVVGNHLLCEANNTNGWQQKSLDLSAFANQRGTLTFHLQNDPIGTPSVFLLDDVAIPVVSTVNCSVSNLQVGPSTLTFNAKDSNDLPVSQSFTINNSGAEVLNWSASGNASWFYLDSNQGTTPATVNVNVSPSGLGNGVHNGQITIESPGASGSPKTVNVVLSINGGSGAATLQVSTNTLAFNLSTNVGNPGTQSLTISNAGSGVLNWSASEAIPWLSLDASSGTTPATLNISVDGSALSVGTHSGNIIISSPGATGSPRVISVSLTVSEGTGATVFLPLVSR